MKGKKNMSPQISVVIPFLREGNLLGESIESVLAQSFTDFEIVLVDNNANQETRNIANLYTSKYSKSVKLFHESEQGACSARNLGIRMANGKYIALLDADDLMKSDRLGTQLEILKNRPDISLVSCFHDSMSHDGKTILQADRPELSYGSEGIREWKSLLHNLFKPLNLPHYMSFDLFSAPFYLFRKEDAIKAGLFDPRMNPRDKDDWEFSFRLFEIGGFFHVPKSLQFYREESSGSRKFKNKDLLKMGAFLQEQKFFAILWERYGTPFPGNLTAFKRLQAFSLKRFGCTLMSHSQGKDAGKKMLARALMAYPRDLRSWKLYIKALAPSRMHPRFFEFDQERMDDLEIDMETAESFLKIPFQFPKLSGSNSFLISANLHPPL